MLKKICLLVVLGVALFLVVARNNKAWLFSPPPPPPPPTVEDIKTVPSAPILDPNDSLALKTTRLRLRNMTSKRFESVEVLASGLHDGLWGALQPGEVTKAYMVADLGRSPEIKIAMEEEIFDIPRSDYFENQSLRVGEYTLDIMWADIEESRLTFDLDQGPINVSGEFEQGKIIFPQYGISLEAPPNWFTLVKAEDKQNQKPSIREWQAEYDLYYDLVLPRTRWLLQMGSLDWSNNVSSREKYLRVFVTDFDLSAHDRWEALVQRLESAFESYSMPGRSQKLISSRNEWVEINGRRFRHVQSKFSMFFYDYGGTAAFSVYSLRQANRTYVFAFVGLDWAEFEEVEESILATLDFGG